VEDAPRCPKRAEPAIREQTEQDEANRACSRYAAQPKIESSQRTRAVKRDQGSEKYGIDDQNAGANWNANANEPQRQHDYT
jgi:hypothetical protein